MRVAVYYRNNDIRIEDRPVPNISSEELLLKILMCGICGSDVMEWYRIKKAPRVLGHEVVGVVSEVGNEVDSYVEGDRVFVSHHVPCDKCRYCLRGDHTVCETLHNTNIDPGGFSEYTRVPSINIKSGVFPLPDDLTDEEGVLIEPLGCVIRGQERLNITPGDTVLVLGSGVSGILHIQLARNKGASSIFATDIIESRLKYAKKFGCDETIYASKDVPRIVRELNNGKGVDHAIVSTAAIDAVGQSIKSIDEAGSILFFAPPKPGEMFNIDINDLWNRQVSIVTSYAASPTNLAESLELIKSGIIDVKNMVTHRLPLAETGLGFKIVAEAKESLKVIVEPNR